MALVRWQPFREMTDVQREMNRLFDDMLSPTSRRENMGTLFSPAAELNETDDNYELKLEVPGLEPDDISIEATAEAIAISGERHSETKSERSGLSRTEFRYGKFQRVIPLPGRIQNQQVAAEYKNGILHLTLPKAEEEKSKVVKVNVNR
ncbi:MAG: Hsp20/alpha crystallin family protein [Elainellaceae cyanobacterium]